MPERGRQAEPGIAPCSGTGCEPKAAPPRHGPARDDATGSRAILASVQHDRPRSGPAPLAVISASVDDPVAILHVAWLRVSDLEDCPIAENWGGARQFKRRVPVEDFVTRARAARSHEHSWTLSSTMTDLCVDKSGQAAHAKFDLPAPETMPPEKVLTTMNQAA